MNTETLVPDELRGELIKEAQINLLQLHTTEVASQLTLDDFKVFASIQPTEYIDKMFDIKSRYGTPNLEKFVEVSDVDPRLVIIVLLKHFSNCSMLMLVLVCILSLLLQLVNKEMYWVVTEICGEPNVVKRMRLIKQFIKIASKHYDVHVQI